MEKDSRLPGVIPCFATPGVLGCFERALLTSVVELSFEKKVRVSRPVMLAKAGIQNSLKFLDSGSR